MSSLEEARAEFFANERAEKAARNEKSLHEHNIALTAVMADLSKEKLRDLINESPAALHCVRIALLKARRMNRNDKA